MVRGKSGFKFFYYGGLALVYGVIVSYCGPSVVFTVSFCNQYAGTWNFWFAEEVCKKNTREGAISGGTLDTRVASGPRETGT